MGFLGRLQPWRRLLQWGVGIGVAGLLSAGAAQAREHFPGPGDVAAAELPAEAHAVQRAIRAGGPFKSPRDGVVFANRERLLPAERRGYYHEYTVPTPGAHDRGARRIVCGGDRPEVPDACFYTADHYASFRRIQP